MVYRTVVYILALAYGRVLRALGLYPLASLNLVQSRLIFVTVNVLDSGITIKGDITGMNLKAGKAAEFVARPITRRGKPGRVQVGSARVENSLPELFRVIQNPTNELAIIVVALLPVDGAEVSLPQPAVVALVADGDTNTETEAIIRGEVALNWLPEDSTAFEMDQGTVRDATNDELTIPTTEGGDAGAP